MKNNRNTYYTLLEHSYPRESFKNFKRSTKKMPENTLYKILLDDEIITIKKKNDSYVKIDEKTAEESKFQESDNDEFFLLNTIKTPSEENETFQNLNLPIGTYKKLTMVGQNIENEKEYTTTYYLLSLPEIDKQQMFSRKENTISSNEAQLKLKEYRNFNDLKNSYILFAIDSHEDDDSVSEAIKNLSVFTYENNDRMDNLLPLFENCEINQMNEFMFDYISTIKAIDELDNNKELENHLKLLEKQINEEKSLSSLLSSDSSSLTKDWTYNFYNDLIYSYGKTKDYYNNQTKYDKNSAIFYDILTKKIGLSQIEAENTLSDMQNYYNEIKSATFNNEKIESIDSKNINFLDLYYQYRELIKNNNLKTDFNDYIKEKIEFKFSEADDYTKKKQEISTALNMMSYNKQSFETDLLVGNIKFPKEYQNKIMYEFNSLKSLYEENIILDMIKNKKVIDFISTNDFKELKSFGNNLETLDIPEITKDLLILKKYKDLNKNGQLFKSNENFINKYISNQIIPREYKLEQILNIYNVEKGNSKTLYKNKSCSLVLEKETDSDFSTLKLITHLKTRDIEETIALTDDELYITKSLKYIKNNFKEDEEFKDFIDKSYNDYFSLTHISELNKNSKPKQSYITSIKEHIKEPLLDKKGIIIKSKETNDLKIIYLPETINNISNSSENYFTEINLDSKNALKEENKYNLKDIKQLLKKAEKNNDSTIVNILPKKDLNKLTNYLIKKEQDSNYCNKEQFKEIFNSINMPIEKELEQIKTLANNIPEVEKYKQKSSATYKVTKQEIINNLTEGNIVILNNFSGDPSTNTIRFLSKGLSADNIIELEITKKGTKSFKSFLKNSDNTPNYDVHKYFEIKTNNIDVNALNELLEKDIGKDTSCIFANKNTASNNIDIFWNRTTNCLENDFQDSPQSKEILNSFIQKSFGKTEPIKINKDVQFIFFEDKYKTKTMIKIEKNKLENNEKNLYSVQFIQDNKYAQYSIDLQGIEFENGKLKVNEDFSKFTHPNEEMSRNEELKMLDDVLHCMNFQISDSKDSIDAFNNNLLQDDNTLQKAFKFFEINGILKNEIRDIDEKEIDIETLYKHISKLETTESKNLLITFLKEDNLIRRGPTDVDCDYMGDPISNKIIDIIETTIKNNPNLNTFKEVLENAFLTAENKDISVEDLNSFYEKLNNKVTEEVDIIRNFSKQENFNEYLMSIKSEEAHLTMSGCIESENILDKLQDSSKKADTINNTNDNTESAQQTGTQSIINKEDLSAIIRFITACKINEKEELSSNEKYNDYQAYFKQTKERLELKFNSGQIKEPFEKITNSINSGEFYKYIDIIKEVEASEKTASDSDLLELFKPQKELEIKINKDNTFTIEPKGIIEINKNGQEISIDFNSTFIKDPEKTKIEECIKNNLSDFNIEKTKDTMDATI